MQDAETTLPRLRSTHPVPAPPRCPATSQRSSATTPRRSGTSPLWPHPPHLHLPGPDVPGLAAPPARDSAGSAATRSPCPKPATGPCATTGAGCCATGRSEAQRRLQPIPHPGARPRRLLPPARPRQSRHRPRRPAPGTAPRALDERGPGSAGFAPSRAHPWPRNRVIALIPYYAGARISEVTGLDVDDVRRSARKGTIRIYGKRGKIREVGIHPKLRFDLEQWLSERLTWPGHRHQPSALPQHQRRQAIGPSRQRHRGRTCNGTVSYVKAVRQGQDRRY